MKYVFFIHTRVSSKRKIDDDDLSLDTKPTIIESIGFGYFSSPICHLLNNVFYSCFISPIYLL